MAAGERFGDQVRLVPGVQLVAQVLDVALDGARCDPELLRALFRGEAAGDALQNLALTVRQSDEIILLPGKIHPLIPLLGNQSLVSKLISPVMTAPH